MRNAFKNFRRDRPDGESQPKSSTKSKKDCPQPPSKRLKLDSTLTETTEISEDEYKRAIASLKQEFKKSRKNRDQVEIKQLMEKTSARRRQWIISERPLVSVVVKEFPALKSTKVVSDVHVCYALKSLTHGFAFEHKHI